MASETTTVSRTQAARVYEVERAGMTFVPISSIERMVVGWVHPRLVALQEQVPDPELALEVLEAVHEVLWRAGDDQIVLDLLLVGHRRHVARAGSERHPLPGPRADARRREVLDRAARGRAHPPLEEAAGLAGLRPRCRR